MEPTKIGEKLKQARISAGYKVQEVSAALKAAGYDKASVKTVYSWESGNSQPSPDYFLKLCDLYGISDILGAFGYRAEKPTIAPDGGLSPEESIFISLPPEIRQQVLSYMRFLVEQEDRHE